MKKKITIIADGNSHYAERVTHEISKLVSEANTRPEIHVSMDTSEVQSELDADFRSPSE